jgi:hypothetical protein
MVFRSDMRMAGDDRPGQEDDAPKPSTGDGGRADDRGPVGIHDIGDRPPLLSDVTGE